MIPGGVLLAPRLLHPGPPKICADDALQSRALDGLATFAGWLRDNDVPGYVGEVGWPAGPDEQRWALQPVPGKALNPAELGRLQAALARAGQDSSGHHADGYAAVLGRLPRVTAGRSCHVFRDLAVSKPTFTAS